jgi:transcription elongation factor Elf1
MSLAGDMPTMTCPGCGAEHPGWCSHPSRDGDGTGGMVCGICGHVEPAAP